MSIFNLDKIFKPRRVALIGIGAAPADRGKRVLANLLGGGFRGIVYPVSSEVESVTGVPTYPDLASLPRPPDRAVICSPADQVPQAVSACGAAGILGVVILSGGFREAGAEGARREQQLAAYRNQKKMIDDTEQFIERFRYKSTKAVQVQSRIKQLEKLDRPEVEDEDSSHINIRFAPAPRAGSIAPRR